MSIAAIGTVAGARPVVQLGVGDTRIPIGQARWDLARWDESPAATWAGLEPTWHDITCFAHEVEVEPAGRDRALDRWSVGVATVIVGNTSGWADLGATPSNPAALTLRPGRQLRIGMALDSEPDVTRWLYHGYVDDAEPGYDPELGDIMRLGCIDAKGEAGTAELALVDQAIGALDTASERIHRVLDLVGWWRPARDIQLTSVELIATELGELAVDAMDSAAESAAGAVFGDNAGRVAFRGRDWLLYDPSETPIDATIGNIDAGDVCPSGWDMAFRREDIATRILAGRVGEVPQVYDDLANQARYGVHVHERLDLECVSPGQIDVIGERMLRTLSPDYMPRVAAVTIDPATSSAARDLATHVDPTRPTRYRCRLRRGGRDVFDREYLATAVRHLITPEAWTCRIALDVAEPFIVIGERWDSGRWDEHAWSSAPLASEVVELRAEARALIAELQEAST